MLLPTSEVHGAIETLKSTMSILTGLGAGLITLMMFMTTMPAEMGMYVDGQQIVVVPSSEMQFRLNEIFVDSCTRYEERKSGSLETVAMNSTIRLVYEPKERVYRTHYADFTMANSPCRESRMISINVTVRLKSLGIPVRTYRKTLVWRR